MSKHQPLSIRQCRVEACRNSDELLETDPMHADMLRHDQAFHHPTDVSLVIATFPSEGPR